MIKRRIRKVFYSSSFARRFIGLASILSGKTTPVGTSHLNSYLDAKAIGPLQQSEALLLFAIVKTTIPMTIVEFGFHHGHSAFNFLQAMRPDARLYSYDISVESRKIAKSEFVSDCRFHFIHKSQADFLPSDIDNRPIDFVFFDAAHHLGLNCQTFNSVHPLLTEDSIVCIHDTGVWKKKHFLEIHSTVSQAGGKKSWLDENTYAHQNDERIFVNWILETYPDYQAVHFHAEQCIRHGLSILQQKRILPTA
jgi:cephalosporin hydroxylase